MLVAYTLVSAAPESPLLTYDAALAFDFLGVVGGVAGPVAENVEALVHELGLIGWNLELVHGLVERRVRVEIGSEPHADALQVVHEVVLREPLGAIERHVLVEVREPALVVILEHRAGVDGEPQERAVLRLVMRQDEVGQPVGELAGLDV